MLGRGTDVGPFHPGYDADTVARRRGLTVGNDDFYGPPGAAPFAVPSAAPPPAPPQYSLMSPPPPPVGAATTQRNWMGYASMGLLALGGGLLGFFFGLFGYLGSRRGIATNGTVALWGAILNVAVPVGLVGVIALAALANGDLGGDRIETRKVAVGECLAQAFVGDDGLLNSNYVTRLDCEEPHWGQVYFREFMVDSVYPGDAAVLQQVEQACVSVEASLRLELVPETEYYFAFFPSEQTFAAGDRLIICVATAAGDKDIVGDFVTTPGEA